MTIRSKTIVRVAIQRPLYKLLDYSWTLSVQPITGTRVIVPLGNTRITAIIVETNVTSEIEKLKSVIELIDSKALFDTSLLALLKWASQYYFHPIGEVLFHALPSALRKGKKQPKTILWKASLLGLSIDESKIKKAPKQFAMLQLLRKKEHNMQELKHEFGKTWKNILNQLNKKDLIQQREIDFDHVAKKQAIQNKISTKTQITLTEEQNNCIKSIILNFKETKPKPILLHGITGSGKTEVYLQSIHHLIEAGKQVLVLVPEIGLTPQLVSRFKEHFPQNLIASLHSSLNQSERLSNWLGAQSGAIDIIIGTRSAVFTPMKNLGAIIIDEEHDASFKQQEGFLYQARNMAIKRAHDAGIPILLGSATPSLESLFNVKQNRYEYLRLNSRPGERSRPKIVIHDTRALLSEAGISSLLMNEIRQHVEKKQQVMLFLNRRGFAPVLMCPSCGWHAECKHCDIGMTYHAGLQKVICHHCGAEEKIKSTCPDCNDNKLTTQGHGTERIEQVLNTHFPDTPVIRVDRDSTSRKGELEKKLQEVKTGKPVILIGTQMLTKGHDFPNLTLVGILDIDQALFSMDFRAQEHLAQQIIQVAGRAGRGDKKGKVILQSCQPEHPLLLNLLSLGYYQTAKGILKERALWAYPPYGAQTLIRTSAKNESSGLAFLKKLRDDFEQQNNQNISILGPIPSPLAKRANRYRFQLLFSAPKRGILHNALENILILIQSYRKTGGVRYTIDIDPTEFL